MGYKNMRALCETQVCTLLWMKIVFKNINQNELESSLGNFYDTQYLFPKFSFLDFYSQLQFSYMDFSQQFNFVSRAHFINKWNLSRHHWSYDRPKYFQNHWSKIIWAIIVIAIFGDNKKNKRGDWYRAGTQDMSSRLF